MILSRAAGRSDQVSSGLRHTTSDARNAPGRPGEVAFGGPFVAACALPVSVDGAVVEDP
jgi:hypothetical protein